MTVTLREDHDRISLSIRDNGCGIEEEHLDKPDSFGLLGIRERIRLWNGDFKLLSVQGKGTTVQVSLPVDGKG